MYTHIDKCSEVLMVVSSVIFFLCPYQMGKQGFVNNEAKWGAGGIPEHNGRCYKKEWTWQVHFLRPSIMITLVCQLLVVLLISFQNIASMGSWAEVGMSIVSLCRSVIYPVAGSSICTATEIFLFSWFQWQYNCFLFLP